ncbi:potassium-transporting ATPase subunit F [Tessaracoccus sp. HDW20]|nr:potassium-transporting ATPase subunit F [Tessaracoccus coleopterorum]NHB84168.1 potassium-transporting ATPase subunit F [Tessaracoccus coleopterorum]
MIVFELLATVLAVAGVAYLVVALIRPEWFA